MHLPHQNLGFKTNPKFKIWSENHQARAEELIAKAKKLDDLKNILRDRKNAEAKRLFAQLPMKKNVALIQLLFLTQLERKFIMSKAIH